MDGHRDAADAKLFFTVVDRIAALAYEFKLARQHINIGDRPRRPLRQTTPPEDGGGLRRRQMGQQDLANAGAVRRHPVAHLGERTQTLGRRLLGDIHDVVAFKGGEVSAFTREREQGRAGRKWRRRPKVLPRWCRSSPVPSRGHSGGQGLASPSAAGQAYEATGAPCPERAPTRLESSDKPMPLG